jgi:hypothetical protein
MSFDKVAEQLAYGIGNVIGIVAYISPVGAVTLTAVKTGSRTGESG